MVRDEGDDAALADDPGDEPEAGGQRGRAGRAGRSYFFRTDLDERDGARPAGPARDDGYEGEEAAPLDDADLDPTDTLYSDEPEPGADGALRSRRGTIGDTIGAIDPNATLRHGAGLVIPPEAQPLPPGDDDGAYAAPLRPTRATQRASDEAPLPSLEELEDLAADPEATSWGDEDEDDPGARGDDDPYDDDDDDDLITELAPGIMPTSDAPPFDEPQDLDDPLAMQAELLAAREALDRATRAAPDPGPPPPVAPPPPAPTTSSRATSRSTARLEGLTLVGGDAEAQRLVRDAISRAAERVAGPDGAVTWRVPMGALVEALRDTLPDPRQEEIARLEEALAEADGVIDEARVRAATLERELAEARGRTSRLEGGSTRLERELADVRAHAASLERDLTDSLERGARLDEGLERARGRQGELEREAAVVRRERDELARERQAAQERAATLDDDLTLLREELSGLEAEAAAAQHQAARLGQELASTREELARSRDDAQEALERGRELEALLDDEQRVSEGAQRERDEGLEALAATREELAGSRATAARELAALSQEHHDARRALEHELAGLRAEGARLDDLVVALLGDLPVDEGDPLAADPGPSRRSSGQVLDPRELLTRLRALVARVGHLEGDRRRALLLPVPPFQQLLERLDALRGDEPAALAGAAGLERLSERCRAGQARYLELRQLLQARRAGAHQLVELAAVVREALVIEDVLES